MKPLKVTVYQSGFYDLYFNEITELNVPCLKLEDTYTGQIYSIVEGQPLNFELSDTTVLPRFILHLGQNYESATNPTSCYADSNGSFEIDLEDSAIFDYTLDFGANTFIGSGTGSPVHRLRPRPRPA